MSTDWLEAFRRLYRRQKAPVLAQSENVMSRRISGQLGGEEEFSSYEMVILYIPVSHGIDRDKLTEYLVYLIRLIQRERYPRIRFGVVLFQDLQGEVTHHRKSWGRGNLSSKVVGEYIDSILDDPAGGECKIVDTLEPMPNVCDRRRHPNSNDLLVFVTDAKGCTVEPETLGKLKRFQRRCLWLVLDKEKDAHVEKSIPQSMG